MKATNILKKIGNIAEKFLWMLMILFVISLFGAMVFVSFYVETLIIDVMLIPIMIVFLGLGLNYFIALLCGNQIYNTGIVHNGSSMLAIKTTPKYYKRKIYIDFIQCLLFAAYLIKIIFNITGEEILWAIAGIIIFLLAAIFYFIVGLSSIEKSKS